VVIVGLNETVEVTELLAYSERYFTNDSFKQINYLESDHILKYPSQMEHGKWGEER
jgi:hypothetical protein